jgi:hypothetical protein
MAMLNSPHPGLSVKHDCIEALGLTIPTPLRWPGAKPLERIASAFLESNPDKNKCLYRRLQPSVTGRPKNPDAGSIAFCHQKYQREGRP